MSYIYRVNYALPKSTTKATIKASAVVDGLKVVGRRSTVASVVNLFRPTTIASLLH